MRLFKSLALTLTVVASVSNAAEEAGKEKHAYQSDVSRLRKIVINSLYSHRDVFLRELISNANDAIEKLRLRSLTNKDLSGENPLNITIQSFKDEDGSGRIVITDTGIGMTPEELTTNLGTLAKSGTSEFLAAADTNATDNSNLIGAFGLGFYSSFLVADEVTVASRPPASSENPNPSQHIFRSNAEESVFETYPDPRGNTLEHGTEITLHLKSDAKEYLDTDALILLVQKHSSFSSSFPIYIFTQYEDEEPIEEEDTEIIDEGQTKAETPLEEAGDEDEAVVEEVKDESKTDATPPAPKTRKVIKDEWRHLNKQPPLWMREPKDVTDEEYKLFYTATFKDYSEPHSWIHFKGDTGSGVSFRAIVFLPRTLNPNFWHSPDTEAKDLRILVKRTLIMSGLGDERLPKWASFVKAVIDADDLPLNVSRETLQSTKFLKQVKQIVIRRLIQLFTKLSQGDAEKYQEVLGIYGPVLKLGAVETKENSDKMTPLLRWPTNQRNSTSLEEYISTRKKGQTQIFYHIDLGKSPEVLAKSVFVEKLHARGYEVFLFNEPLDEIMTHNLRTYKSLQFQDVAKAGLLFGDEDETEENEKEQSQDLEEKYKPLLDWLKIQVGDVVREVKISQRLVTSPCAIVADTFGLTATAEKLLNAQQQHRKDAAPGMQDFQKKQKLLEINPKSPLIQGLLRRVEDLLPDDDDSERELQEVANILIDGALIRSGFDIIDTNSFFERVDRVLRRSLGVSQSAKADAAVKPAPPIETGPIPEKLEVPPEAISPEETMPEISPEPPKPSQAGLPRIELPDEWKDMVDIQLEEIPDDEELGDPSVPPPKHLTDEL